MPKEIIHSRYKGTDNDTPWNPFVKVGWDKPRAGDAVPAEPYVEVGVLHTGNITLDNQTDAPEGWYAQLDRAGLNRLIRTLRTARDSAFGADA